MQCRLPRKNVPDKPSLTWYFNETVSWTADVTYEATFTCNSVSYDGIRLTYITRRRTPSYIQYRQTLVSGKVNYTDAGSMTISPAVAFKWKAETYRTITFNALPTGDLLTWLKANAIPQ